MLAARRPDEPAVGLPVQDWVVSMAEELVARARELPVELVGEWADLAPVDVPGTDPGDVDAEAVAEAAIAGSGGPDRASIAEVRGPSSRDGRPRRIGHTPATAARPAAILVPAPTAEPEGRAPMGRLCETDGLTEDQTEILKAVRTFVEEKILPVATELEHKDEYPTEIVEGLKELGIFGLMIPEEYDGLGESLLTYALCVEEIARGWMSVSGIINTHFIVAYMLLQHGTEEQKKKYLPEDGDRRGPRRLLDVRARAAAPTWRRSRPRPSRATTAATRSPARRCG